MNQFDTIFFVTKEVEYKVILSSSATHLGRPAPGHGPAQPMTVLYNVVVTWSNRSPRGLHRNARWAAHCAPAPAPPVRSSPPRRSPAHCPPSRSPPECPWGMCSGPPSWCLPWYLVSVVGASVSTSSLYQQPLSTEPQVTGAQRAVLYTSHCTAAVHRIAYNGDSTSSSSAPTAWLLTSKHEHSCSRESCSYINQHFLLHYIITLSSASLCFIACITKHDMKLNNSFYLQTLLF